ncbi:hypothetical protein ACFX13_022838 [Malus domestica]
MRTHHYLAEVIRMQLPRESWATCRAVFWDKLPRLSVPNLTSITQGFISMGTWSPLRGRFSPAMLAFSPNHLGLVPNTATSHKVFFPVELASHCRVSLVLQCWHFLTIISDLYLIPQELRKVYFPMRAARHRRVF